MDNPHSITSPETPAVTTTTVFDLDIGALLHQIREVGPRATTQIAGPQLMAFIHLAAGFAAKLPTAERTINQDDLSMLASQHMALDVNLDTVQHTVTYTVRLYTCPELLKQAA